MSKFKVGDTVIPINKTRLAPLECSVEWNSAKAINQPFLYIVRIDNDGNHSCAFDKDSQYGDHFEESDLKLFTPKRTKSQRITTLENKVAELELIVEQLRENNITIEDVEKHFGKPSTVDKGATITNLIRDGETVHSQLEFEGRHYRKVDREAREGDVVVFLNNHSNTHKDKPYKTVKRNGVIYYINERGSDEYSCKGWGGDNQYKTYEPITQDVQHKAVECEVVKSPNQLRAEIIEKAKAFIDENGGDDYSFEIDADKRTVVAWKIEPLGRSNYTKCDVATCHENDVFNEDLGRAIAFGRAEGLDVSEFEQAVQPTFAVGQKIKVREADINKATIYTVDQLNQTGSDMFYVDNNGKKQQAHSGGLNDFYQIINDTNAIYNEVSE